MEVSLKMNKNKEKIRNLFKHPRGINCPVVILLIFISIFIIVFVFVGELNQLSAILFTLGGLIIALSLHYISVGNTVYSVAVPLGNKELFKRAHSISIGASKIATSGTLLIFAGLLSYIGEGMIIDKIFRVILCMINVISLLILWKGLLYTLRFFPWITIDKIPPKEEKQSVGDIKKGGY